MKCTAAAVVGIIALIPPATAQDSKLKTALATCMTWALTHPLPQMLDVDNPAAVVYACQGQPALALFTEMELVSDQTVEGGCCRASSGKRRLQPPRLCWTDDLHAGHRGNRAIREAGPVTLSCTYRRSAARDGRPFARQCNAHRDDGHHRSRTRRPSAVRRTSWNTADTSTHCWATAYSSASKWSGCDTTRAIRRHSNRPPVATWSVCIIAIAIVASLSGLAISR